MEIPGFIKIFAHEYCVKKTNQLSLASGAVGRCCSNTLEIEIDTNLPESGQADTFIHEILEALKYQLQLELEHKDLCRLAIGLLTVIRDNKIDFRYPYEN